MELAALISDGIAQSLLSMSEELN